MKKILFLFTVSIFLISCSEKKSGKISSRNSKSSNTEIFIESKDSEYAKKELENAKISNEFSPMKVIPDSKTAVEIAEKILFPIYGENNIIRQRPYNVKFIDGYFIITGTLPKSEIGGSFIIIMSSKDGKVIKLTHGK